MKQKEPVEIKKRRNKNKLLFGGMFFGIMLVVAFFSACNAVKKYGDDGKEETAGSLAGSKEETEVKGNGNSMERYLETVDPNKRTKEHLTEVACFSRELSEEEQARFQDFQDRYEDDGLAPKEEIEIVDKMEDTDRELEHPVYEIWNHEYFLPERTLTDEDLLQMVDLGYKVNCALAQKSEEMWKETRNSSDIIDEAQAGEIAGYAIEKMSGMDVSSLNKEVQENGVGDYMVNFTNESGKICYNVSIDLGTGEVRNVYEYTDNIFGLENAVKINQEFEQLYSVNYQKAKTIFNGIFGSDKEIVSSSCRFRTDKSGQEIPKGEDGRVHYYFQMKDDLVCHMEYDVIINKFSRLSVEEKKYTAYQPEEELEKEGVQKEGGKYIVPLNGAEKEVCRNENLQWVVVPME